MHIALHFLVPALLVLAIPRLRRRWAAMYAQLLAGLVIDVDHLLASPIYDPDRCSIGFHPLHSFPWVLGYGGLFFVPKLRVFGWGVLLHLGLDALDCW